MMYNKKTALPIDRFLSGGRCFNFRPILFFTLFFAFGLFCAYQREVFGRWAFLLLPVPLALVIAHLSGKRDLRFWLTVLLTCSFALGCFAFSSATSGYLSGGSYFGRYSVSGVVQSKTSLDGGERLYISSLRIDGVEEDGVLVLTLPYEAAGMAEVSDEVLFSAVIESTAAKHRDNYVYGYAEKDIRFHATDATNFSVTKKGGDIFAFIRSRLRARLYAGMDENAAAMVYGILTGDDSGVEIELMENVQYGGIAHIFAVSGLNIGALFSFCQLLFSKTRLKGLARPVRFLLLTGLIVLYGGVCGFSASVLRATVTCIVFYAAELLAVKSDGLERMAASMLVCLSLSPLSLFTAGFQLTFGACFGILFFSRTLSDAFIPALGKRFGVGASRVVGEYLAVTLAAQLFTTPILLQSFGYLSTWSLLLNCVFVPIVSAAFAPLLVLGVVCLLLPESAMPAVLYIPSQLVSAALFFFETVDLTGSGIRSGAGLYPSVAWYVMFGVWSDKISLKNFPRTAVSIAAFFAFAGSMYALSG